MEIVTNAYSILAQLQWIGLSRNPIHIHKISFSWIGLSRSQWIQLDWILQSNSQSRYTSKFSPIRSIGSTQSNPILNMGWIDLIQSNHPNDRPNTDWITGLAIGHMIRWSSEFGCVKIELRKSSKSSKLSELSNYRIIPYFD